MPKKKRGVAKTAWSYHDGGFNANVDGGQWLGRVHQYLELPLDAHTVKHPPVRVPFVATAAQTRAWAERLTVVFKTFDIDNDEGPAFLRGWRDFLKTCGGYDVQ